MKYRMYIDEVGNPGFRASEHPNNRYLSLTGIIMELGYVAEVVAPRFEELKIRYFGSHPDDPVVLHRKELLSGKPPFQALRDPELRAAFDAELLELLGELDYRVVTVVIDKLEQKERYTVWRFDPYHYALTVLAERYVRWLQRAGVKGDLMAESRGGKEDRRLKETFARLYMEGTEYVAPDMFRQWLSSKELKIKPKVANVTGLQMADLIAHPSFLSMRMKRDKDAVLRPFGSKIVKILEESKLLRSPGGRIEGWGLIWLP